MKNLIQFRVQNSSQFDIDTVWENAKDLEHVATLHKKTNFDFELLYLAKESEAHEYDVLFYRSRRKFFFLSFQACGFRKILSKYHLEQIEYIPMLRLTVCLNSLLEKSSSPTIENIKTLLIDEVVIKGPWWIKLLKPMMHKSLQRHTRIQCLEDESFRARRSELKDRGLKFPFSIFAESTMSQVRKSFQNQVNESV